MKSTTTSTDKQKRNNELIERYQSGDNTALDTLFRENMGIIRRSLRRWTDPHEGPDEHIDIAYETFIKCAKLFDTTRGLSFVTYFMRAAINNLREEVPRKRSIVNLSFRKTNTSYAQEAHRRSLARRPIFGHEKATKAGTVTEDLDSYLRLVARIDHHLESLPEPIRTDTTLRVRGLTNKQIGKSIDCGGTVVSNRSSVGLQYLRAALRADGIAPWDREGRR